MLAGHVLQAKPTETYCRVYACHQIKFPLADMKLPDCTGYFNMLGMLSSLRALINDVFYALFCLYAELGCCLQFTRMRAH